MKRNKKLIKKLKARSNRNILRKKMLGDNVFWINASSADMKGDHVFADMDGEHPVVRPNVGDHPFVDMKGDGSYVKSKKKFAKMQGDHPFTDMNGEHPRVKPVSNKKNKEQ